MTTPSKSTIIGRFQTDAQRNDFLQLENKDGGSIFGGIDGSGYRYGTLAAGGVQGVLVKTADYQVTSDDNGLLISVNSSGTVNLILPVIAPDFPWFIQVECIGSGNVVIHSTPTVDGSAGTITLTQNQGLQIISNGTAYFTQRGVGGSGSTGFAGVSTQTGDYTALSADTGKLITFSKSSAVALTLPAVAPGSTWFIYVQNRGAGFLTINRNGLTIDGAAGNTGLLQNSGMIIFCDGSNYFTDRGVSGSGNVNSQTNDYTALPADSGKLISMNKASAVQLTLPATSPGPYWFIAVQDVGAGTLTINRNGLNIDGAASNLSLVTGQGIIIYTDGTNYFTARGSGTASNVALKPAAATGIQFVAVATGADTNDGLSWGTAKLTIMAAYDALPSSGGTIYIAGQGVDATQWPHATATAGEGIWLMGSGDPNYASPPTGWRKAKNGASAQVAFIGVPSSIAGQNDTTGNQAGFIGGDSTRPAIWLSGVSGISFRNLYTQYPKSLAWAGINSNSVKNDSAGGSDIGFFNCGGNVSNQSSSYGPVISIGANLFWVQIENCGLQANNLATDSSDNRCAILISAGSGNTPSGVIYVKNCNATGGGGFRYDTTGQVGTGNFTIRDFCLEGTGDSQPACEIVGTGVIYGTVENALISDAPNNPPLLVVPEGQDAHAIHLINCNAPLLAQGPCQIIGGSFTGDASSISTLYGATLAKTYPSAKNQQGDVKGIVLSQVDGARRAFGPSLVRFANNLHGSTQLPGSWSAGVGTGVTITATTGPEGTNNAGLLTSSADAITGFSTVYAFSQSIVMAAGDYLYIGAWVRSASSSGLLNGNFGEIGLKDDFSGTQSLQLIDGSQRSLISGTGSIVCPAEPTVIDGNWQWIWGVAKVVKGATSTLRFTFSFAAAYPIVVSSPIFCQIPSSSVQTVATSTIDISGNSGATQSGHVVTIKTTADHGLSAGMPIVISGVGVSGYNGGFVVRSVPTSKTFTYYNTTTGLTTSGSGSAIPGNDSEVAEWSRQVVSYPDGLSAGSTASTLRGVPIAFGGSGDNFIAKLDHTALTANRTITIPDGSGSVVLANAANVFTPAQEFDGGVKIGSGGTLLTQAVVYTPSLTPAAVALNTSAEQDFSVAGVTTADTISVAGPAPTAGTAIVNVRVKSNGVVSITFGNFTGGSLTPAAGTYRIIAFRS